jgi:hypothetical protein
MIEYLKKSEVRSAKRTAQPRPRLNVYGYTLRGGSPTDAMVQLSDGRWRRVYVLCWSNCSSLFVKVGGRSLFLDSFLLKGIE